MGYFDDPKFDATPAPSSGGNYFNDPKFDVATPGIAQGPVKIADPQIGKPEDLSFAEKYIAPILDKLGGAVQSDPSEVGAAARFVLNNGNARGAPLGRLAQGAADPGVAIAQIAANALPNSTGAGAAVNKGIADEEAKYQAARGEDGSTGFDPLRVAGQTGISLLVPGAQGSGAERGLMAMMRGAAQGGEFGLLNPVTDGGDNFWKEKLKQGGIGALTGGIMQPLTGAAARVISPNASTNADVAMLRAAGVNPTIGQTLGGWANTLEEKATSLPILGDMIAAARRGATKDFNNAVLNTATGPIGKTVSGAGHDAVAEAGNLLGGAYNDAAAGVNHINFDTPSFNDKLSQLMDMTQGLTPDLRTKFQQTIDDQLLRKMSPNGSIAGADLKSVDSALGKIAADWRGFNASPAEREFGDAVRQLQQVYRVGIADANPAYGAAKDAADQGWRTFRLARNAAAAGKNADGVFTPAQLLREIQASSGKAQVGQGTAYMQDAATAAQNVLGNKYPDSGTVGRYLINMAAAPAHYFSGGATLAPLLAGAAAYARPVQNALVRLLADRPDMAPVVANSLRRLAAPATLAAVPMVEGTRNDRRPVLENRSR